MPHRERVRITLGETAFLDSVSRWGFGQPAASQKGAFHTIGNLASIYRAKLRFEIDYIERVFCKIRAPKAPRNLSGFTSFPSKHRQTRARNLLRPNRLQSGWQIGFGVFREKLPLRFWGRCRRNWGYGRDCNDII